MDNYTLLMAPPTRVNITKTKGKERVFTHGLAGKLMMESGLMESKMVRGYLLIIMERLGLECGKMGV